MSFDSIKALLVSEPLREDALCFIFWSIPLSTLMRCDYDKDELLEAVEKVRAEMVKPDIVEAYGTTEAAYRSLFRDYTERFCTSAFAEDDYFRFATVVYIDVEKNSLKDIETLDYFLGMHSDEKLLMMGEDTIETFADQINNLVEIDTFQPKSIH